MLPGAGQDLNRGYFDALKRQKQLRDEAIPGGVCWWQIRGFGGTAGDVSY
jgi:hypothetical protein